MTAKFRQPSLTIYLSGLAGCLLTCLMLSKAAAVPVNFEYLYNGEYNPYSPTPPTGQTQWDAAGGGLSPTVGDPAPGLARFNDASTTARVTMLKTFGSNISTNEWEYTFDMNLVSGGFPRTFYGVRDEGGTGRQILFSVAQSNSNLFYSDDAGNVQGANIFTDTGGYDLRNQQHQFKVQKVDVNGTLKVRFYVDDVLFDERDYSSFPSNNLTTQGFGLYSSTPGTSQAIVDEVRFGAPTAVNTPVIGDTFHYDGTYAPDSLTPPSGNSTWTVVTTGANTPPAFNSPIPGVANFSDPNTTGRLQVSNAFQPSLFTAAPASFEWEYSFDLAVENPGNPNAVFGVRDEGGNGKFIMMAHSTNGDDLFYTATNTSTILGANLYTTGVDGTTLGNGDFHNYRVVKALDDNGEMQVSFFLDDMLLDTRPYSSFPDDISSDLGFGFFSSTPGTSDYLMSDMYFGPVRASVVPEPASLLVWFCCGIGLLRMARRKRNA